MIFMMTQERQFLEKLNESHDSRMKRENEIHRSRIASMERQFLEERHEVYHLVNQT